MTMTAVEVVTCVIDERNKVSGMDDRYCGCTFGRWFETIGRTKLLFTAHQQWAHFAITDVAC